MDVTTLKAHIKNSTPGKFYIFTGPEWKIQWIYIFKMAEQFQKTYKYIDSISSVYSTLNNKSFITKSYLYVVRDDTDIMNNENLQDNLENMLGNNILILLLSNVDKRIKFYKKYSSYMCQFDTLSDSMINKYIEKEIKLSESNTRLLADICENDYGRCLLEIDKIKRYRIAYGKNEIFDNDAFALLLKEGTIYQPAKDAIFDFIDAVLDCDLNCFNLYEQCKTVNEATMVMISVLYNNAKATLQVQAYNGNDVGKATGLNYFQIQNAKKHVNKRRNSELIYIMKLCQECQEKIVTGRIEEEYVMDYILGEII